MQRPYTVERHVVFDTNNEYSPTTPEGRRLLAHELTHVMQQRKQSAAGSGIAVHNDVGSEREAARSEEKAGSGNDLITASQDTANPASLGLQRQAAKAGSPGTTTTKSSSAPASSSCLEAIEGEDVSSLLEAGAVTVVEFGAYWCNPCHMLEAGLQEICQKYKTNPPGVPVRFYTIDITLEGNKKLGDRYAPDGGVPHLYIYVGSSQKHHSDFALEPDVLSVVVDEQVEYATTSGAKRGAKSGMKWGGLAGGLAGLGGAIAILSGAGGLSGNTLMLAALGSLVGGAAVGIGLGAGIGAIAGALTDDRKRGPRTQQRHHLDATGISRNCVPAELTIPGSGKRTRWPIEFSAKTRWSVRFPPEKARGLPRSPVSANLSIHLRVASWNLALTKISAASPCIVTPPQHRSRTAGKPLPLPAGRDSFPCGRIFAQLHSGRAVRRTNWRMLCRTGTRRRVLLCQAWKRKPSKPAHER